MGIGRITDYGAAFAGYRVPQIPSIDVSELQRNTTGQTKEADAVMLQNTAAQPAPISESAPAYSDSLVIREVRKPIDTREISLKFNVGDDYGYLGKDSKIEDLDMQKAISDMKKDQVLQEYQYFVGKNEWQHV